MRFAASRRLRSWYRGEVALGKVLVGSKGGSICCLLFLHMETECAEREYHKMHYGSD